MLASSRDPSALPDQHDRRLRHVELPLPQLQGPARPTAGLGSAVALVNRLRRRGEMESDLQLYRNLLALLPYTVRVRKVVDLLPRPTVMTRSSVVYFRPSRAKPGRHLGWS